MEQVEISKIIKRLERIEKTNGVEVEDILKFLKNGDQTLVQPLKELSSRLEWKPINKQSYVPLATWTDIVCIYLEFGLSGLKELLLKKDKISEFVLCILEELTTVEALMTILSVAEKLDLTTNESKEIEFIKKYSYSLNMISFNIDRKNINDSLYVKLIDNLKNIIEFSNTIKNEVIRANCIACMGKLGQLNEIDYLNKQRKFESPYTGLIKKMTKNIQNAYR